LLSPYLNYNLQVIMPGIVEKPVNPVNILVKKSTKV